jgi:hypothetical protein
VQVPATWRTDVTCSAWAPLFADIDPLADEPGLVIDAVADPVVAPVLAPPVAEPVLPVVDPVAPPGGVELVEALPVP